MRASQRARGEDVALVDALLSADERRRSSGVRFDELRAEQKQLGKQIPKASGDEKAALLSRAEQLKADVKAADAERDAADAETQELLLRLGNLVHPDVPVGGEEDFVTLETHGTIRDFGAEGFEPKDHLELGQLLGAIDVERGAKVSGSRFYFLTGVGALLELALVNAAIAQATAAGFTPMLTPALVRPQSMAGTGFLGQAAQDVYHLDKDDLYLVGTSEVPLAAYHMDEIIDADRLPLRYAGLLPVLPPRGRLARQGHPGHLPRAPVRQGRDVLVRRPRGLPGRAPAPAGVGEAVADLAGAAVPRHRRRLR